MRIVTLIIDFKLRKGQAYMYTLHVLPLAFARAGTAIDWNGILDAINSLGSGWPNPGWRLVHTQLVLSSA